MTDNFSRVEILVSSLQSAINVVTKEHDFVASKVQSCETTGFNIKFVLLSKGDQRLMLVQPISGILKHLLEEKGEGTSYRLSCFESATEKSDFEIISGGMSNSDAWDQPRFMERALSRALSSLDFS
ncbi:hypothetical protein RMR16_024980 (plasmid) [Agrobacterium sp. rho-13.3]|uniref:hypothetical protein n=1 Tax=Agrobacterium sp. rho-13.3 TaxID=3072980 RepID=UPI002A16DAB8|nr:hypothetical protein [Agrobacterium sp. rho-13.3]MDX8310206.1 hypothetical protein [Agrobacterium sp. rho-13.3]